MTAFFVKIWLYQKKAVPLHGKLVDYAKIYCLCSLLYSLRSDIWG